MRRHANTYALKEAAAQIGIAAVTLKRWLLTSRVAEVPRDRNGWRRFTDADIRRIREFADKLTLPGEGVK